MAVRPERSIPLAVTLTAVGVALSIALLVGWTILLVRTMSSRPFGGSAWLLVAGIVSFGVLMAVLIVFGVFLVREIREGHRQTGFIDSVTHELKSPLASLRLCLDTLARPELAAEKQRLLQDMMRRDVDRLSGFIDDVLEASRVAHGQTMREVDEVELRALVGRCVETVARRHGVDAAAFRVQIDAGVGLTTDATALETIVKNLLDNAVKYSDGRPEVLVTGQREGAHGVVFEVQDQGIGLLPMHLERIFERFYRVPTERVRARRGTGLGLYVVSALVRSLGGHIAVRSAGPGAGTTFTVRLPDAAEGRA